MFNAQFIKSPMLMDAKAQRGITSTLFASSGYVIALPFNQAPVAVHPGTETEVPVPITALVPNANVESVVARLHVADADFTSEPDTTTVSITKNDSASDAASGSFKVAVDQPKRPRNVQLRLKDGDVFWTFGGVLNQPTYTLPDFAGALNLYLDTAKLDAPLDTLPFVLKSDTPGRVGIEIAELHYSQVKTEAWLNPLDNTTRVDRNLELDFGAVERLPLEAIPTQAGQGVELRSISFDVGGQFGPDRLLGSVEQHDGRQFATISADYTVAQGFLLSSTLVKGTCSCSGITCFFSADAQAELYVELQKDASGYPATDAPLASANLSFTPPDQPSASPPWTLARFAAPVELHTGTLYWIVVKGVRGSARLGLQAPPGTDASQLAVERSGLYVNRGGQSWKSLVRGASAASLVALLGVVYLPGSDDQSAAVEISVSGVTAAGAPLSERVDPGKAPRTIRFEPHDANWNQAVLEVRSHGQGTLSIANVIRVYRLTP